MYFRKLKTLFYFLQQNQLTEVILMISIERGPLLMAKPCSIENKRAEPYKKNLQG